MRRIRKRYWFWLDPNDPLAEVLDMLGPTERNRWIVQIVRAGLVPGGLRDVLSQWGNPGIDSPPKDESPSPGPAEPTFEEVWEQMDVAAVLDDAIAQLGLDD